LRFFRIQAIDQLNPTLWHGFPRDFPKRLPQGLPDFDDE
jgi:hypothetical protein